MIPPPDAMAAIPPPPLAGITVRVAPLRTLPAPVEERAGLPPDNDPVTLHVEPPFALAELLEAVHAACAVEA